MEKTYEIEIKAAGYEEIAQQWQLLESTAPSNIFLSWLWVSAWLTTYRPMVKILIVRYQGKVVGLGLLTKQEVRRHGVFHSQILRFGRTGDQKLDQIWPEYAGVLLAQEHQKTAPAAIIQHLLKDSEWDEIELAAMAEGVLADFKCASLNMVETWSAPSYGVDLRELRSKGKNYLQSLSRNTRYQINRCRKRYEANAPLSFKVLTSAEELESVWPVMADLHRKRWQHTEEKSGFTNEHFVNFHRALVVQACKCAVVEFCVLYAGERFLGALYNFVYRGCVYFYLSALAQEQETSLKPGLLLHSYAIEHYLQAGCDFYDFMGGDSQYKRSLGRKHCELKTVYLQRERNKLKVEQGLKQIKHLILKANMKSAELLKRTGLKT